MPSPLTLAMPLTEAWMREQRKKFDNYRLGPTVFENTPFQNEQEFFDKFRFVLQAHLFSKEKHPGINPVTMKRKSAKKSKKNQKSKNSKKSKESVSDILEELGEA